MLNMSLAFSQWTTVCGTGNGFVDNFEVFDNELYATGFFTSLCGTSNNHIVKYDGNSWQAVGAGYENAGHQLKAINNSLYFVGYQPNIDSNWVYHFDGTNFNKVGDGVYLTSAVTGFSQTANLYAMTSYNGHTIVSGEFDRVGSKHISGIMQWNGTAWDSLGSGLAGNIPGTASIMYPHDLCDFGTDLVVCGNFQAAGGITCNGVARWDGSQWHSLGAGFNGTVYGICTFNGELYAGGGFTMSGTTPLKSIAKWNGSSWVDPGFRMYYNNPVYYSFVHTLKVLGGKLYIAGGFDRVEMGTSVLQGQAVCAFDGTNIDLLSGGVVGKEVEAIALYDGKIYAGGGINNSNSFIAKYTNTTGLPELEALDWTVSPNPAAQSVSISGNVKQGTISIFSLNGKLCAQIPEAAFTTTLDVSSLDAGMYILRISDEHRQFVKQ